MPQDLADYLLSISVTFAAGASLSAIVFQAWGSHWKARAEKAEEALAATVEVLIKGPDAVEPGQYWPTWRPEFAEYLKKAKAGEPLPFSSLEELMRYCDEHTA